jgi:hypothetical protein
MVKRIEVTSSEAFTYLRGQLELSGKTLANLLLNQLLKAGKVYAYVPDGTSSELLFMFNSGGLYPFEKELFRRPPILIPVKNNARPVVMNLVQQHVRSSKDNCCLFEEPVWEPSDSWLKQSNTEYIYLGKEMYYFFGGNELDLDFQKAFGTSEGYYFLCVLSTLDSGHQQEFSPFSSITSDLITYFVSNMSSFFIRAYDGEGYLQWTKA